MKRAIAFFSILLLGAGVLYYTQRRPSSPPVSANPLLDMVADAQHDLSRVPLRLTRISDEEEIRIGDRLAAGYTPGKQILSPEDLALQRYVRVVGGRLALSAHRSLPYQFHLDSDPRLINAFSLPGGHVFIGRGMLNMVQTEDELAAILGHEIAHIDLYHCAERVQVEAQLRKLPLGGFELLARIPVQVWQLGYHKDEEFEADRAGTQLAVDRGYSPYGTVILLEHLQRLHREYVIHASTPERELEEFTLQGLTGYFRTHPLTSERLEATNRLIQSEGWRDRKAQKPFRMEYRASQTAAASPAR